MKNELNLTDESYDLDYFNKMTSDGNWVGLKLAPNNRQYLFDLEKKYFSIKDDKYIDGFVPNGLFKGDSDFLSKVKNKQWEQINANGILLGPPRDDWHLKKGVLFLDRDGIINEDHGYCVDPKKLELIPGCVDLIQWANKKNMKVIVLTNQSGVARNIYSEDELEEFHSFLSQKLKELGAHVDLWIYCPYHPDKGEGNYKKISVCRKPMPGMIYKAMESYPIDLEKSFMIGDKVSDAFSLKGLKNLHLQGKYDLSKAKHPVFKSIAEIVAYLNESGCTAQKLENEAQFP